MIISKTAQIKANFQISSTFRKISYPNNDNDNVN